MKTIISFLSIVMVTFTIKAQGIYLGGSINIWHDKDADQTVTSFVPEIGYNINKNGL